MIQKKAEWLAALRSGQYQQGKGLLFTGTGFCCLGVYAEVLGVPKRTSYTGSIGYDYMLTGNYDAYGIADRWASGLQKEDAVYLADTLNDDQGKTFAEIADWIEANLEGE